jgi:hypothetical protein
MELTVLSVSADELKQLSATWSPWLDICHFVLSVLAVRQEVGVAFSRSGIFWSTVLTILFNFLENLFTVKWHP